MNSSRRLLLTLLLSLLSVLPVMGTVQTWWDWFPIEDIPVVGEPGETVVTGVNSDGTTVDRDATTTLTLTGGATYDCREKNGSIWSGWSQCSTTGSYSPTWDNDYQVMEIRAVSVLGVPDPSPEERTWTNFICSGTQVVAADDVEAKIESAATNARICIEGGDYVVDNLVNIGTGKDLQGQPGPTWTADSPETGEVELPEPGSAYPVDITDGTLGQVINTSGCTANGSELPIIMSLSGNAANTIEWIGWGGADSQVNGGTHCGGGVGTGFSIGGGDQPEVSWGWGHDNGLQALNQTNGRIHNNFFGPDNGIEQESLGFGGGVQKSTEEYEFDHNISYRNPGNGQWCDHSTDHSTANKVGTLGCYVHNNIMVNNGRWGWRYEYWPRVIPPNGPNHTTCTTGGVSAGQDIPEVLPKGSGCHHYPQSDENYDADIYLGGIYINNAMAQNGAGGGSGVEGGFSVQAAQNALIQNNACGQLTLDNLPASLVGSEPSRPNEWSPYGLLSTDRTFGNNASNKCGQAFNSGSGSDQQTDLWNIDIYSNTLNGDGSGATETVNGCSAANTTVYCFGNSPPTGDDAEDTANDWDAADMP